MQKKQDSYGLVWFTNNLRVQDNLVLQEALNHHEHVIGVYCFDPRHFTVTQFGFKKTERYRAHFLIESVTDLKKNLEKSGIPLYVYHNTPENILPVLVEQFQIKNIYCLKEWTQEEHDVQRGLVAHLPKDVVIKSYFDQFLYHPNDIDLDYQEIPKIFTAFRKHVEKKSSIRNSIQINLSQSNELENKTTVPNLQQLGFEDFEHHPHSPFPFKGGESTALERLQDYVFKTKKIGIYKQTRNGLIGIDYSSKFSPWLANGCLSARTIFWAVKNFEDTHFKNQSTYWLIFELIWRDFFKYISLKHGNDLFRLGGILNKHYTWRSDSKMIDQWIYGQTAEPFVNANMIELNKTGWMSNRGRQNVASYFAKSLELDWRIGAAYFESMLIDYDVHSNYGNWMYVAGVGNDPRDRKFNVKLQAERYDNQGTFQRLWLQNTLF